MRPTLEQSNAFLNSEALPGVAFKHNAHVRVIGGEYAGGSGSLISVEELGQDPIYLVELESNRDALVPQSCLTLFEDGAEEPAVKDDSRERQIPTAWRQTLRDVVGAFAAGDFQLSCGVLGVEPIAPDTARQISDYIQSYGATLTALPEDSWHSSVCIWTGNRWDALVDLWTEEEGRSDLVLHAHVVDEDPGYLVKIHLVYVP